MRPLLLVCAVLASACTVHKSELDETLEWMDNTYNPHEKVNGADGHGKTAWYAPQTVDGNKSEFLANGMTETFTYNGCDLALKTEDNPLAQKSQEILSTVKFRFNLRDIDPASIKVTSRSHLGDFPCEGYTPDELAAQSMKCDHAEMGFKTRNEAGLMTEDRDAIFVKLTGSDHESKHISKSNSSYFEFDDVEYAGRFAKAFAHAIQLCGGKPSPF